MSTPVQTNATSVASAGATEMTYREAIRAALEDELATDPCVCLMGEDVATAGGVFKTNEGLVEKFGSERVRNTPICENGFVGVALGMAVTGLRPVVEIMFSDFLPTAGDALVNELAKYRFMSGGQCVVPVTVRSIGGATGRFGTQHSATGESWFLQLPGLRIVTASSPATAYGLLRAAIRDDNPVLFFEHRGLYGRRGTVVRGDAGIASIGHAQLLRSGADVTVVATLLMADRALIAADELAREGIDVEVIDPCWLRPLDVDAIAESVRRSGRLVVAGEEVHSGSWGATVISELTTQGMAFRTHPAVVALRDDVLIPYSPPLEDEVIPSVETISAAIRAVVCDD
jgi:pyruvate/2-oxoglutarate/acetoin dehydrogenase E1 component